MPNLRAAAELLAAGSSPTGLTAIASALGGRQPLPLDDDARARLGLTSPLIAARIATVRGAQRLLLILSGSDGNLRDEVRRIARQISSRAPQVLWTLLVTQPHKHAIAIASWDAASQPLKIASLSVDTQHVLDSDAETLRSLLAAVGDHDLSTHLRWFELLGREAVGARFFRAIETCVDTMTVSATTGSRDDRALVALLYLSRLLFLGFIQAKGWLDDDYEFLSRRFDNCMRAGGDFHRRVLQPLFFGTLNTPASRRAPAARAFGRIPFLNGGLFARTPAERRARGLSISDEAYGSLFRDAFGRFRFTAREASAEWSEAAVDPEMLGRAFENLMGTRERRVSGAYYTPNHLVQRAADSAIHQFLIREIGTERTAALRDRKLGDPNDQHYARRVLEHMTILDPACGSGAFLVHVLEALSALLRQCGDHRPPSDVRREVVTRSIFGVDVNPTAVWLCELRLWLSVVIDDEAAAGDSINPLPNLDHNIHIGDALAGQGFAAADPPRQSARMGILRRRYARAVGMRKRHTGRLLLRLERDQLMSAIEIELQALRAQRMDLVKARRGRDLFGERYTTTRKETIVSRELRGRATSLRELRRRVVAGGQMPFVWSAHFADVASRGGFDAVVGNPPWVRIHNLPPRDRVMYRQTFKVARMGGWRAGADLAGAGRGFANQVDLAALFAERSITLLKSGGVCSLLLPAKLWRSLAGAGLRRLLSREVMVQQLEDFSKGASGFAAAVYPSVLVAIKSASGSSEASRSQCTDVSEVRDGSTVLWRTPFAGLPFDQTPGAPWLILPPRVRRSFDRLAALGIPMAASPAGRPYLGVKCGCNEAFIVRIVSQDGDWSLISSPDGRRGTVETALLRPLIRGETIMPWRQRADDLAIIWTVEEDGRPLKAIPPGVARWLAPWRQALTHRSDAKLARRWWALFRTHAARADVPRVAWADMGRAPRAVYVPKGDWTVPLNSCYVARCQSPNDALALTAILNSPVAAAWLNALAEPARGEYRRYLGWTMALLPLPARWERARLLLAPIAEAMIRSSTSVSMPHLTSATLDAYGIRHRDAAPLLAWLM